MNCKDYRDIIAAHVDGQLAADEEVAVRSHLARCVDCERVFYWEAGAKAALCQNFAPLRIKSALHEKLSERLENNRLRTILPWFYGRSGLAVLSALLVLLTVPMLFLKEKPADAIFSETLALYDWKTRVSLNPSAVVAEPSASPLNLAPWGYRLVNQQATEFRGVKGFTFLYQGFDKDYVLAQEFKAANLAAPEGGRVLAVSGKTFVTHSQDGVNLIAWKENDLLCILASRIPKEKLVDLAQRVALHG